MSSTSRRKPEINLQSPIYRTACYRDSPSPNDRGFTVVIPKGMFPNLRAPINILRTFCVFNLFSNVDSNLIHYIILCSVLISVKKSILTCLAGLKIVTSLSETRIINLLRGDIIPDIWYLLTVRVSQRLAGDQLIPGMANLN